MNEEIVNVTNLDKQAIAKAAHMLGDTWALLIVSELLGGTKRFSEIQQGLDRLNPQTLSARLKMLEQFSFVTRRAYAEIPPRVEYELTPKGRAVAGILQALSDFGVAYMSDIPAKPDPDCKAE